MAIFPILYFTYLWLFYNFRTNVYFLRCGIMNFYPILVASKMIPTKSNFINILFLPTFVYWNIFLIKKIIISAFLAPFPFLSLFLCLSSCGSFKSQCIIVKDCLFGALVFPKLASVCLSMMAPFDMNTLVFKLILVFWHKTMTQVHIALGPRPNSIITPWLFSI